jgi:2-C-methyl-D-erythritol 4-phosphate cytidylyltransferase
VHDAARPLLPLKVLNNAIHSAQKDGNALVCVKASDTLLKSSDKTFEYIDRSEIYYIQTPQIFRFKDLSNGMTLAYKKGLNGTDESSIMYAAGYKIYKAEGSHLNFKVTTADDIKILKQLTKISAK